MTAPRTRTARAADRRAVARAPMTRHDPERMLLAVVVALLEVEAGRRPLDQLAPALSPTVARRLRATLARRRRDASAAGRPRCAPGPGPDSVRALSVSRPSDGVLEAAVAVETGGRTTALCVRLESWRGFWRVTELARPEDGLPAVPPGPPRLGPVAPVVLIDLTEASDAPARDRSTDVRLQPT